MQLYGRRISFSYLSFRPVSFLGSKSQYEPDLVFVCPMCFLFGTNPLRTPNMSC